MRYAPEKAHHSDQARSSGSSSPLHRRLILKICYKTTTIWTKKTKSFDLKCWAYNKEKTKKYKTLCKNYGVSFFYSFLGGRRGEEALREPYGEGLGSQAPELTKPYKYYLSRTWALGIESKLSFTLPLFLTLPCNNLNKVKIKLVILPPSTSPTTLHWGKMILLIWGGMRLS